MIQKLSIKGWRINFVFRHKFEKKMELIDRMGWNKYELGVWFKKYKAIGRPKEGPAKIGKDAHLTNCYMFGVKLLVCKFWIDISYRPLTIEID